VNEGVKKKVHRRKGDGQRNVELLGRRETRQATAKKWKGKGHVGENQRLKERKIVGGKQKGETL